MNNIPAGPVTQCHRHGLRMRQSEKLKTRHKYRLHTGMNLRTQSTSLSMRFISKIRKPAARENNTHSIKMSLRLIRTRKIMFINNSCIKAI